MEVVTGDHYLESLFKFVENNASGLIDGTVILKLYPVGLHYVQSRLEALHELERLIAGAPVDYLRAYVSDLGDHRALEQLRRILCRVTKLKIVSVLPSPARDPTPVSLLPFGRLKVLELRGCDLSTSAAKGLIELRHTLEKLTCHNSTDALRHVFVSRIADIKESPQWSRLSFVSCACNGLILMDESLQLLPAVETLDLSRNNFAKVDNLRKCSRLTHLDLGFNQLRSVASFSEVTCRITKLVLRNNALTSLRGIEALKSIEGLDVSYNIISSYSELEGLSSLPSLNSIWLAGNPLCCARWYRPQVFSLFAHPGQVKLDNKEMSTRESWKRQLIVARRQRKPMSYGFYSPARVENEGEALFNGKRKKLSRLACITSEEHGTNVFLEQELLFCESETQGGSESFLSDNEGEINGLINRIECMKKERSKLWLEDFKDWIHQGSENWVNNCKNCQAVLPFCDSNLADTCKGRHIGESSRYSANASDLNITSGDDRSTNVLEFYSSFADSSVGNHGHQWPDYATENRKINPDTDQMVLEEDNLNFKFPKGEKGRQVADYDSVTASINLKGSDKMNAGLSITPIAVINSVGESMSSSAPTGSPPHYEEDILYRRLYLEEEFLQVSAESISIASSDSDTSCNENEGYEYRPLSPKAESFGQEIWTREITCKYSPCLVAKDESRHYAPKTVAEECGSLELCPQQAIDKLDEQDNINMPHDNVPPVGSNHEDITTSNREDSEPYENKYAKRKPRRRVVSLLDENSLCFCEDVKDEPNMHTLTGVKCIRRTCGEVNTLSLHNVPVGDLAQVEHEAPEAGDYVENYFNSLVADSAVHETCKQFILCTCIVESEPKWRERPVAVILSSELKLYVILCSGMHDGSGYNLSLLASHKVEDVKEVLVGLGLLVIRVYMDKGTAYLLITKSMQKTRHFLSMMGLFSCGETFCSLRSLDQVQVKLFDKQICAGLGVSIYQYSMLLFWHKNNGEEEWASRSIFVNGGHLFVCTEDFLHFSSLSSSSDDASYFSLDSCCAIADVSQMVIDAKEKRCVTLTITKSLTMHCLSSVFHMVKAGFMNESNPRRAEIWKLKWFSKESLFEFVALLKAIHTGMTTSNLSITCVS